MIIRYDLPRGQFFDEEGRYVNPATVAEKLRQAESEAVKWKARQRSTEQKLGYEEKLRGQAEADLAAAREEADALGTALATLTGYAEEFTEGQSIKKGERLGMALTYAAAVLRADPDPMKAVHAHWDDMSGEGFLVTHFDLACYQPGGEG